MNTRVETPLDGQNVGGVRVPGLFEAMLGHKVAQFSACAAVPLKTGDFVGVRRIEDFHVRASPACRSSRLTNASCDGGVACIDNPAPFGWVETARKEVAF